MAESALRNLQRERMDARRARIGMEPFVPQAPTKTAGQSMADFLGGISVPLSFVPLAGDVAGLGADAAMYAAYPEERTLGNAAMTLAGIVPGIPGAAAVKAGLDMSQAARMQRADEFGGPSIWYRGSPMDEGGELSKKFLGENTGSPSAFRGFFFASNPETASSPAYATHSFEVLDDYVKAKYRQMRGIKEPLRDSSPAWEYFLRESSKPIVDEKFTKDVGRLLNSDYQLKNDSEEYLIEQIKSLSESQDDYLRERYKDQVIGFMGRSDVSDELKSMVTQSVPEIKRMLDAKGNEIYLAQSLVASSKLDPPWARGRFEEAAPSIFDNAELGANVGQYKLQMNNPYIYDMGGKGYREMPYDQILANALSGGHDSAIIKNTFDGGVQPTDIGVIFEPRQARSISADFDPAKRNSANLTAGIMGGAVGLSALRQINQNQQQE